MGEDIYFDRFLKEPPRRKRIQASDGEVDEVVDKTFTLIPKKETQVSPPIDTSEFAEKKGISLPGLDSRKGKTIQEHHFDAGKPKEPTSNKPHISAEPSITETQNESSSAAVTAPDKIVSVTDEVRDEIDGSISGKNDTQKKTDTSSSSSLNSDISVFLILKKLLENKSNFQREEVLLTIRNLLIKENSSLRQYGLVYDEEIGKWFTNDLQTRKVIADGVVEGVKFSLFPSKNFINSTGVSNTGKLDSKKQIEDFLIFLGFKIATLDDVSSQWKEKVLNNLQVFEKLGLRFDDGKWYVGDYTGGVQNNDFTKLYSNAFNKEIGIGCNRGYIRNLGDIILFLKKLGFSIASQEEEVTSWKKQFFKVKGKLKKVGIVYDHAIDGWFLDDIRDISAFKKISIGNKKLASFPNQPFNRKNNIGDKDGEVSVKSDIVKLFKVLGCKIISQDDVNTQYKRIVRVHRYAFLDIGILIDGDIYKIIGPPTKADKWGEINKRKINSFPNRAFNIRNGIGDKKGNIKSRNQLIDLLKLLGFTENEYVIENKSKILSISQTIEDIIRYAFDAYECNISGIFSYYSSSDDMNFLHSLSERFQTIPDSENKRQIFLYSVGKDFFTYFISLINSRSNVFMGVKSQKISIEDYEGYFQQIGELILALHDVSGKESTFISSVNSIVSKIGNIITSNSFQIDIKYLPSLYRDKIMSEMNTQGEKTSSCKIRGTKHTCSYKALQDIDIFSAKYVKKVILLNGKLYFMLKTSNTGTTLDTCFLNEYGDVVTYRNFKGEIEKCREIKTLAKSVLS